MLFSVIIGIKTPIIRTVFGNLSNNSSCSNRCVLLTEGKLYFQAVLGVFLKSMHIPINKGLN